MARVACVGAGAAVLLAGCTGEVTPIVTESPTVAGTVVAEPSPTPSPSVSPSDAPLTNEELWELMPDGADRPDLVGAMVTARFFLEQYAPMFHTGDTRVWEALSGEGCQYCAGALTNVSAIADQGLEAVGGEVDVDSASVRAEMLEDTLAAYSASAKVAEARLRDGEGGGRTVEESGAATFELRLAFIAERWVIAGVRVEDVQ